MMCPARRLRAIASLFLVLALSACAAGTPAPVYQGSRWSNATAPEPAIQPAPGMLTVRRGDTVYSISRTYNAPIRDLIAQNGLEAPYPLYEGQKLKLPAARVHVVEKGDTALAVSQRYGVPLDSLAALNDLDAPRYIVRPGQRLLLPYDADFAGMRFAADKARVVRASRVAALPEQKPIVRTAEYVATTAAPAYERGFIWPVNGKIISAYGIKTDGRHNDGVNIAVAPGTPVRAAKSGVVTYAGNEIKGYGNLLLIKHNDGYVTAYAHNAKLLVRRGQEVKQGEIIAEAGSSGGVPTAQLHFEIRRGRDAMNPVNFLPGA